MDTRRALRTTAVAALIVVVLAGVAGCGGSRTSESTTMSGYSTGAVGGVAPTPSDVPATTNQSKAVSQDAASPGGSDVAASTASVDRLVISSASMTIEVKNLDAGVSAVRALATKYGATISDLSVSAGSAGVVSPQPLDTVGTDSSSITPGSASITLRVPAEKLGAAEHDAATLGRVISQTASESDVTQQHVDMAARLKNMRAEESRLRAFLNKATKVSEMLAIETELSRVRGEIESMQAQLTYLERQAALATLTLSLSEPGALVSPAAGGWGFAAAVRDGVRAAADVIRSLITIGLAMSPLLVLVLLAVLIVWILVRRRRRRRMAAATAAGTPGSPDADAAGPGDRVEP